MSTFINSILLYSPKQYAKTVIEIIEKQLDTAKNPARISKLNYRLKQWKKVLDILSKDNEK